MKVFLLDLWLDLREKRLAWLAIALVAAVVLLPVFLWKGAKETPAPVAQTAQTGKLPLETVVKSQDQTGPVDSKLESFSPRDPFEPAGGRVATSTSGASASPTGTGTTGTSGVTTGTGTTGGGTTGTGEPGTTGGGTTGTGTTGPSGGTTTTTFYTYTTNLRFGRTDHLKRFKSVSRLDLIPSQDDPKLVFLGVTTTAKTAVFLVDSSLGVDTEGACKPSADECTFLYLRPTDAHDSATFTDADGNTFDLVLDRINRVAVSSAGGGSSGDNGRSGNSNNAPAFTGSNKNKSKSASDSTPDGQAPPGERSAPFTYRGFFSDESR